MRISIAIATILPTLTLSAPLKCTAPNLSDVEKLICCDTELVDLDENLNAYFAKFLLPLSPEGRNLAQREQRAWIRDRDVCRTRECLRGGYQSKIASLSGAIALTMPSDLARPSFDGPALSSVGNRIPNFAIGSFQAWGRACFVTSLPPGSECDGATRDVVKIVRGDATNADVSIALNFYNGHSCSFSGAATWVGGHLVATPHSPRVERLAGSDDECRVHLYFSHDSLKVESNGHADCRPYCGMRGGLSADFMERVR
jgi:uncharacterized protein